MSRINTNVQSILATRVLNNNQNTLNRALTRLSTGLRINSGKDDPAGLIASENLRATKVAITSAIDNATRADSIVAVAEGGLQEVSSLLLEIESLVDRTANKAGLSDEEVKANQLQLDSILASINRISDQTAFGSTKLLNGNFDYTTSGLNVNEATGSALTDVASLQVNAAKLPEGSYRSVLISVVTGSTFGFVSAIGGSDGTGGTPLGALNADVTIQVRGVYGTEVFSFISGTTQATIRDAVNNVTQLTGVSATLSNSAVMLSSVQYGAKGFVSVDRLDSNGSSALTFNGATSDREEGTDGSITVNGTAADVNGLEITVRTNSLELDATLEATFGSTTGSSTSFEITDGGATFAIAPELGLSGNEAIGILDVGTGSLGDGASTIGFLSSLGSGQTNNLTSGNFARAQRVVRAAIDQVSSLRGRLGAFQKNTLQTTMNSLGVAFENLAAAESAIRDADFAKETSNLTRAQILVSSATATLQLANAAPQNVLRLLG